MSNIGSEVEAFISATPMLTIVAAFGHCVIMNTWYSSSWDMARRSQGLCAASAVVMNFSKIAFRKHTTAPSKIWLIRPGNSWKSRINRAGHEPEICIVLENTAIYVDLEEKKKQNTCEVFSTLSTTISNPWRLSIRGLQGHSDHFLDQSCSLLNSTDDILLVEDKEKDIKEWSWILRSARTLISRSSKFFGRYAKIGVLGSWKVVPKKILLIPSLPCAPPRFMPV